MLSLSILASESENHMELCFDHLSFSLRFLVVLRMTVIQIVQFRPLYKLEPAA